MGKKALVIGISYKDAKHPSGKKVGELNADTDAIYMAKYLRKERGYKNILLMLDRNKKNLPLEKYWPEDFLEDMVMQKSWQKWVLIIK